MGAGGSGGDHAPGPGAEVGLSGAVIAAAPASAARGALRPALRFALAIVGFLAALALFYSRPELHRVLDPVELASARVTAALVAATGLEVERTGTVLEHPSSGFAFEVYHRCTGVPVVALLAIGILALPRGRRRRLAGIAWGAALVLAVNLARLVSLFHLGVQHPEAFAFAHSVLWEGGMILLVVGFWVGWLGRASRRLGGQSPSA